MTTNFICQEYHSSSGWRICHSCSCGSQYYPSKARGASPLLPVEYYSEHPDYNNVYGTAVSAQNAAAHGGDISFSNWSATPTGLVGCEETYDGAREEHYEGTYEGEPYEEVPNLVADVPHASRSRGKGKGKQLVASHRRTESEESIDPLQWTPGKLRAEGLLPAMSNLTIGQESSSHASSSGGVTGERIKVSARMTSDGKVEFIPKEGPKKDHKMYSALDRWDITNEGASFESHREQCTFVAKEIKSTKSGR